MKTIQICDGVNFNCIIDPRFKTNKISINFITRLDKSSVTANAIIPFLLKKGYNGCDDFTEFNKMLEELYGSYVSAYIQKVGDYQILSLSILGVDDVFTINNDKITDRLSEILCKLALDPVLENNAFRTRDVELEKIALIDTIEAEINEKRIYAINNLIRFMCGDEPFGIPKYGYAQEVSALTPASIKQAYDKLIKSARVEIMFTGCGGANQDSSAAVFKKAFSSLNRQYSLLPAITTHQASGSIKEKVENMTVSQSKMVLGFSNMLSASDSLVTATKLMIAVLGGTPTSKLFLNVREKLSLCYYCAARYDRFKGIMMVDCGVEKHNIEKARKEILAQLDNMKNGDITAEEISNAVLSIKNVLNTVYDSDSAIESWFMGQILSGTNVSPKDEVLKLDSVTKEDVVKCANMLSLDCVYVLTGSDEE